MTVLAWSFMAISAAQALISIGLIFECSRRGIKYEGRVSLGTIIAFIFAGRKRSAGRLDALVIRKDKQELNKNSKAATEVKMLTACTNCDKTYPSTALGNELKIVGDQVLCPVCRGEGLPVAEGIGSVYHGN